MTSVGRAASPWHGVRALASGVSFRISGIRVRETEIAGKELSPGQEEAGPRVRATSPQRASLPRPTTPGRSTRMRGRRWRRPAACLQCHPSSRRGARRLPDASPLSHPARESRALGRIQDLEWGSGACVWAGHIGLPVPLDLRGEIRVGVTTVRQGCQVWQKRTRPSHLSLGRSFFRVDLLP